MATFVYIGLIDINQIPMSPWTNCKFKDFITLQRGFDLPKDTRLDGQYPVVASTSINGFHSEYKVKAPCITTGRSGALGDVLFINENCWPLNTTLWVKDFKGNDPKFVYYKLKTLNLATYNSGAGVPTLNRNHLDNLQIEIPDEKGQKAIVSIISSYDDLIENNEKRIKILEEMAQRLYTEWFVKFKFPGYEKIKMVESRTEFGIIPEGWMVEPIIKIAEFVNGYPFKPSDLGDIGLPIIKIPELRDGILEKTPRNTGLSIPKKFLVKDDDIIFSWSATLLVNIWNSGDALLNQHLFKVTPKHEEYKSFVYFTLKDLVEKLSKHVVGATMQHLRRGTVVNANIIYPDPAILDRFSKISLPLTTEIGLLIRKNHVLKTTRDLLIPRLVTGKRELKNKL